MALLPSDPAEQKKLLAGLLPLLLLFGYWYFVDTPKRDEIVAMESRLEQLQAANAAAQRQAQLAGPELERRLALYENHIELLERLVPRSEEVPDLLFDMTLRAQESGVELARMKPANEVAGEFYTLKTFEISVLGSFHDVGRFLASIGSLPRIVTPYAVDVKNTPQPVDEGPVRLQADFMIKTYILPSPVPTEVAADART